MGGDSLGGVHATTSQRNAQNAGVLPLSIIAPPPSSRKRSPAAILHSSVIEYLPDTFATVAASDDRHDSAAEHQGKPPSSILLINRRSNQMPFSIFSGFAVGTGGEGRGGKDDEERGTWQ